MKITERLFGLRKVTFLAIALITASSMLFPVLPAMADGGDQSNTNTGQNSTNTNTITEDTSFTYDSSSTATVNNSVAISINTGNNRVRNNTKVGSVASGAAKALVTLANNVNVGQTTVPVPTNAGATTITQTNTNTGSGSTNTNTSSTTTDVNISFQKTADVTNAVTQSIKTGGNVVAGNTSVGNVTSGGVLVSVSISNCVNAVICPKKPAKNPGGGVTPPVVDPGAKGGGANFDQEIKPKAAGPVLVSLAGAPTSQTTLTAANQPAFFPAGSSNNFMLYLLLILASSCAILYAVLPRNRSAVPTNGTLHLGRYGTMGWYVPRSVTINQTYCSLNSLNYRNKQ